MYLGKTFAQKVVPKFVPTLCIEASFSVARRTATRERKLLQTDNISQCCTMGVSSVCY